MADSDRGADLARPRAPVYQPATDVLAGTWRVPCAVRPSLIRREWTSMTGMDRYTGRITVVLATGRVRDRPRAGPRVARQQQAARTAAHREQAAATGGAAARRKTGPPGRYASPADLSAATGRGAAGA